MSKAKETFDQAIMDAENLLGHFNELNAHPPKPELEVLKRAGLVMAMTAWETYVEDRLREACEERLAGLSDPKIAEFVLSKLSEEIKRLNNPTSQKTIQLFQEYVDIDLTDSWALPPLDSKTVRARLNSYINLRGEVVHRARPISNGPPTPHPVTKQGLAKVISLLKRLVAATERALARPSATV